MTVTDDSTETSPAETETPGSFASLFTWRNLVGAGLLLVMIGVFAIYLYEQRQEVLIDCTDAERRGVNESGRMLVTQLDSDITELTPQVEASGLAASAKTRELTAKNEELTAKNEELTAKKVARDENANDAEVLEAEVNTLQAEVETLQAEVETLQAEVETLVQQHTHLRAERQDKHDAKRRAEAARDAEDAPFDSVAYSPPRRALNLQPREPVAVITLGSDRHPKRAQVVLEQVSTNESDETDSDAQSTVAQLPTQPTFLVSAGQFQRSNGLEIPSDDVHVWARWVGPVMLLDVCVDPDARLDPGLFTGDVYVVDPTINPVRVSVEVTAQSRWINWSFLLLIISPLAAFGYVWVVSRHSAGVTPWNKAEFRKWAAQNLVLCFAIGFAAVWATLQVPFNNPTWGSSVIGAAGIIGVGLVAAVTAMTAVAGRVRDN